MHEQETWAQQFENNRGHLRAVAYRMLGSASEADDAVQEAWLRLGRSDASSIQNLGGWLTTVVARVCLDALRSRASRREARDAPQAAPVANRAAEGDPEREALLADSVGLALLVVLDRLTPAERIAFVLHDTFDLPFEEIAAIVGRSPEAARQLASRARRQVRGAAPAAQAELQSHRAVAEAFLAALRAGDVEGLVAVLDPDVVVRVGAGAGAGGVGEARVIRGARNWAMGAVAFARFAHAAEPLLVDGAVGLVWAPGGRLSRIARLEIVEGKIAGVEIIANAEELSALELGVLD